MSNQDVPSVLAQLARTYIFTFKENTLINARSIYWGFFKGKGQMKSNDIK